MVVHQNVGYSGTAARVRSTRGAVYAGATPGVELAGLGCSLAEWDLVAARIPEGLRPSTRGSWNQAFSKAFTDWRRAGSPGLPPPPSIESPLPRATYPTQRNRRLSTEVLTLLAAGPRTVADVLAAVRTSSPASVEAAVYRLLRLGEVVPVGPRVRHANHRSPIRQLYGLASGVAQRLREREANTEVAA